MEQSVLRFDINARAFVFVNRRVALIQENALAELVERRTDDENIG